jgi:hypothetical protein
MKDFSQRMYDVYRGGRSANEFRYSPIRKQRTKKKLVVVVVNIFIAFSYV